MAKAETLLDTTTKRGVYLRILRGKDSKIYLMILKRNQKIFLNEEEIRELQDFLNKFSEKNAAEKGEDETSVLWERIYKIEEDVFNLQGGLQDLSKRLENLELIFNKILKNSGSRGE